MILLIITLASIFSNIGLPHDAMIAVFRISQEGKELLVEINFDQEDYHFITGSTADEMNPIQLSHYLNKTIEWDINEQPYKNNLTVEKVDKKGEHYLASCRISSTEYKISSLSIRNEFLSPLKGHSNICLLYTSPSPRDQRGSRMPSSA